MLVGLGVALAVGGMKVMEFAGGKKGDMQAMMMQQMMKQMAKQAGNGAPGAPGGMPGMGGMPGHGRDAGLGRHAGMGATTPGAGAGFPPVPSLHAPQARRHRLHGGRFRG